MAWCVGYLLQHGDVLREGEVHRSQRCSPGRWIDERYLPDEGMLRPTQKLEHPQRRLLPHPQYPLCANDTCLRIDRTVENVNGDNMRALLVWIFAPDAQVDECPGVVVVVSFEDEDHGGGGVSNDTAKKMERNRPAQK